MENFTLTILEQKDVFNEALYYLNYLRLEDVIQNEDIKDYMNQMLNNERDEIYDDEDDIFFTIVDINFRDELQAEIACAFWNAVCAESRENAKELYEVAFQMYYGIIMALENAKAEGGVL